MKKIFLSLFLLSLFSTGGFALFASSPDLLWNPDGIIINDSKGLSTQKNPKLASDDKGNSYIIWTDERSGYNDIYIQKIDSNGNKVWKENGIPICSEPQNQSSANIIPDGKGGAIVVWEDYRKGTADIYIQKITSNGIYVWEKEGVKVCDAKTGQLAPKVISDGYGGAIVTWYDYRSGKGEDIYAQRITSTGNVKWEQNGIKICSAAGTQWYPEIISDNQLGAIIVWTDFRSGKGSDIYAQHITSNGKLLWQENGLPVCFAGENQAYPKITTDGSGGVIITWDDYRGESFDIYAQKVTFDGKPVWELNGIPVAEGSRNDERPVISSTKDNGAIIVWASSFGDSNELRAQKINSSGEKLWNKEGIILSKASGSREQYKIISLSDNDAAVCWEDTREVSKSIYIQKISESGNLLWKTEGIIICSDEEGCEFPDIAMNNSGGVTIVWQDKRSGNLDILAQEITSDGGIKWGKSGKVINSSFGSVAQQNPVIAFCDKTSHIIAWEDGRNGYTDIYSQRINSEGNLLWDKDGVAVINARGSQIKPQITSTKNGSVIIVWEDKRLKDEGWNIFAQKISKNGDLLWNSSGIRLSSSVFSKSNVKIIHDGNDGAIVTWVEERESSLKDIYAQKINKDGDLAWDEKGTAVCFAPSDQTNPAISTDGSEGAIIVWVDYRSGLFNSDIFSQRINSTGESVWKKNGIEVCTAPDAQRYPDITSNDKGGAIIAWTDKGGGGYDIYTQILDDSGTPLLTIDGIPVCQAPGTQRNPKISKDGSGGAVFVWNDFRNANWDIYAQRINGSGSILWDIKGIPVCTAVLTQYSPELISDTWGTIFTWEDYRNAKNYNIYVQKTDSEGNFAWEKDGVQICSSPDGERNPKIAPNGDGGAVIAWEDFRDGCFGIYAQKIRVIKLQ